MDYRWKCPQVRVSQVRHCSTHIEFTPSIRKNKEYIEASRGAGAQSKRDCKRDWLWVRSLHEEIIFYLNLYFHFALVSRVFKAQRWVPPLATRNASVESGEQSVLTLGSLCLLCCMRETCMRVAKKEFFGKC